MRRSLAAVAIGGAVGLVLAGCGLPDGVDGDLTSEWDSFGEPVAFVPAVETCHAAPYAPTAPLADYQPVDCAEPHLLQTVHVGEFDEEADELEEPPAAGTALLRRAYRECEQAAAEFLGADFRHGRLWLGVATPSAAGWAGDARWFRCDLAEIESVRGVTVERQGSLAGALSDNSELALGCFAVETDEDNNITDRQEVSCDEPHDSEFAGVWRAPRGSSYPSYEDSDREEEVYDGCRGTIAEYVDVPADGNLVFRTGVVADWMSQADWDNGDRAFRCYIWLPEDELDQSLAGVGDDGLPVRTE